VQQAQAFGKIANYVVKSRLSFARNFILTENTRLRSSQPRQAPERYMQCSQHGYKKSIFFTKELTKNKLHNTFLSPLPKFILFPAAFLPTHISTFAKYQRYTNNIFCKRADFPSAFGFI